MHTAARVPVRALRGLLAALSLSMLLSSLGTSIANVGLPSMAEAFHASFHGVQWIVLAYLLAITTLVVLAGWLGDIVGRRRLLLAGLTLFTMASVLCGLANTLGQLIAARAVQGVGAAIMMALTHAFVSDAVPEAHTGSAMGLLGTVSAVGTAVGPSLGGLLIAWIGWRAIFYVNVPLGMVAMVLAYRFLPVVAPVEDHAAAARDRGFAVVAAVFRDRALRSRLAMNVLVSMVMMSTLVVGPFYLSRSLALSPTSAGFAMSVGPVVTALIGVPSGRIADRLGAPRMTLFGLIGIATGTFLLSILPASFGLVGYLGPIAIVTAGYGLFQTANNTVVMAGARAAQRGVTSGLLNLSRNLGLITGASVMGAVFALASGSDDITRAHALAVRAGMRGTYALAALVIVAALTVGARHDRFAPKPVSR